jgi:hypothetical protein
MRATFTNRSLFALLAFLIVAISEDIEPVRQAWQYSLDHTSSSPYRKVSVLELHTLTH